MSSRPSGTYIRDARGICAAHRRRHVSAEDARGGEGTGVTGPPRPARPSRVQVLAGRTPASSPRGTRDRVSTTVEEMQLRRCRAQTLKKTKKNEPTLPVVNNKKLRQSIRQRLGHARDEPRPLHLVLDALHRARPMNFFHQIAPREGHEAVHEGILRR